MNEMSGLISAFVAIILFHIMGTNMWVGYPLAFTVGWLMTKYEW